MMQMSPGRTRSSAALERMVLPALAEGGYTWKVQVILGKRLGMGAHKVDAVAEEDGRRILISIKWQQASGTAEQQVPFEIICLVEAMETGDYDKAYVVLGGEGGKWRTFYTSGGLKRYIRAAEYVEIITLEDFVARANQGTL